MNVSIMNEVLLRASVVLILLGLITEWNIHYIAMFK